MEASIAEVIARGRLVQVLRDLCPSFPGYFLYYPSRRNQPAALAALIAALRFSGLLPSASRTPVNTHESRVSNKIQPGHGPTLQE